MSDMDEIVVSALPDRIFLVDMAKLLERDPHTVRRWVRDSEEIFELAGAVPENRGYLPRDLWPAREDSGHKRIFWAPDQAQGMIDFSAVKSGRQGWRATA